MCQADIVFVAVPPAFVAEVLERIHKSRAPNTIYSDCTSVKATVAEWATKSCDPNFIPGHPMAGHENSGAAFASAWMFRGAKWILCPTTSSDPKSLKFLESVVKDMGAIPVRMDASVHDRQIATLSHLPHALAASLVLMKDRFGAQDVGGGSWQDLTRVGGVDPDLWTQIFMGNRAELSNAVQDMEKMLRSIRDWLDQNDAEAIHRFFVDARKAKGGPKPPNSRLN